MKLTLTNLILAAAVWLTSPAVHAQTYKIGGTVPFAFHAAGKDFSPGKYLVARSGSNPSNVIEDCSTGKSTNLGIQGMTEHTKKLAHLTFHRYGNQYFLASVWTSEQTGFNLPPTAREKEILSATRHEQVAAVSVALTAVNSGL